MKLKKTALALAIAGSLGAVANVEATPLASLVITGGTFAMGVFTPAPNPITNFSGANLIGGYQPATWNTAVAQSGPAAGAVMAWDFNGGGVWVNSFTAASAAGA
jgi:PKD repeat protein